MAESLSIRPDPRGVASLDGTWDFLPGDHSPEELASLSPLPIRVPGLWEAQGHLELDGPAWYLRRFHLPEPARPGTYWTLHFGAVMDCAEVWLNGAYLGSHAAPFTPFWFNVAEHLRPGENLLAVRVVDPPHDSMEHLRLAHGKEGWANHVFPSRPSLYMTYGGIWQPVTLRRHGPIAIRDLFVNSRPDALQAVLEVENVAGAGQEATLSVQALGAFHGLEVSVGAGQSVVRTMDFGPTDAPRWSPEEPVRHVAVANALIAGGLSDSRELAFGLRTVAVVGRQVQVNDRPYRMKSALVQGFSARGLYAEDSREEIVAEVRAAKAMGFNTLRLHIKAFDPTYLEVCDELGMFTHCDIPVAEPIAHEELGDDTALTRHCVLAATEQVRRDRYHPSIIMWSAMNELCLDRLEARAWDRYEQFARTLVEAIRALDPTRPIIENDWVEPSPDRVFLGDVLTAHWYGRLHADYLSALEARCLAAAGLDRPFFVTEFGDWGLPQMPPLADPPFWDTRAVYSAGLVATQWPGTVAEFVLETQRYQGLSDRLQIEVLRRHQHIGGYCLTELTDVPHELNGLLDLHRRPKTLAVTEVVRANQTVLPMVALPSLVIHAGDSLQGEVCVSNDGPPLEEVTVEVAFAGAPPPASIGYLLALDTSSLPPALAEARFEDASRAWRVGRLPGHRPTGVGGFSLNAPLVPGTHDLTVSLRSAGRCISQNTYPIHVVSRSRVSAPVRVVGGGPLAEVLAGMGAAVIGAGDGPALTIIAEGALTPELGEQAGAWLQAGGRVLLLAQTPQSAAFGPLPLTLTPEATAWGSSVFHFTTDVGALSCLPRRAVLAGEDSTVQALSVVSAVGGARFPEIPVVIAYKPVPDSLTGTVIGSQRVGDGRLVFCQYRLSAPAAAGDALARALLGDLVSWAAHPEPHMVKEAVLKEDGRAMTYYTWTGAAPW